MSSDLIKKPIDGEIIGPGEPDGFQKGQIPTPAATVKVTVDILAAMTADCQPEVNHFKNWNQKWRQTLDKEKFEGPFS